MVGTTPEVAQVSTSTSYPASLCLSSQAYHQFPTSIRLTAVRQPARFSILTETTTQVTTHQPITTPHQSNGRTLKRNRRNTRPGSSKAPSFDGNTTELLVFLEQIEG